MDPLVDLVFTPYKDDAWPTQAETAYKRLFGADGGRYRSYALGNTDP